jgi:anti-sigma regulatory factor (Ser/Thr protein kinase)
MTSPAAPASAAAGLRSAEAAGGALRLVLDNSIAAIEAGRQEILKFLAPRALDALVINRLEVVFEEVVSNIVRHGFERGADQTILVAVSETPGAVELVFEDDGSPFDPVQAPEPPKATSIETAKLGGMGVPLIHRLASSLRYEVPAPGEGRSILAGRPFAPRNRLTATIAVG